LATSAIANAAASAASTISTVSRGLSSSNVTLFAMPQLLDFAVALSFLFQSVNSLWMNARKLVNVWSAGGFAFHVLIDAP
jgi:hypothetical protein